MPLSKLQFQPGVNKDDTPLSAEGGFVDSDKVRFVRGKAQTIGGWDPATSTPFTGIARGGHAWSDNAGRRWLAFGTAANLYVLGGGTLTDITPVHSSGVLISPFTTTSGSNSVSVAHVAHGFSTGQLLTFSTQSTPVGGLTLNGTYAITVSDADTYTITAASNATSTQPGGGNVDFSAAFLTGLVDGLGEPGGYGAGAYAEGGYGGTIISAATLPRTWSLDNFGENLLALPRGGALYEFQPATSYPELVVNGDFATAAGWTVGTNWSIAAGVATAVAGTVAANLSRVVPVVAGKVYRLTFTVTLGVAGTQTFGASPFATTIGLTTVTATLAAHGAIVGDMVVIAGAAAVGGITPNGTFVVTTVADANTFTFEFTSAATSTATGGGAAATFSSPKLKVQANGAVSLGAVSNSVQAAGTYSRLFLAPAGMKSLVIQKNRYFAGTVDNVSVTLASTAYRIDEAPSQSDAMFVDPHRIVVLIGTSLFGDVYNPLAIRWSDRENDRQWTPTASNLSGDYVLSVGGRAVSGLATRQQNAIWTDTALYTMRYTGDPATVFLFDLAGTGCGLAGPLAAAEHNGTVFWLSKDNFFLFQGAAPQAIPSAIRRDVFDNIADGQRDKICAGINAGFSEVWWLYPDERDGNECSRYAAFNFDENHWVPGTFARSTWIAPGVFEFPIMLGTDGYVYFHEKGSSAGGGVFAYELKTAYSDIEDGENLMTVRRIVPDFEGQLGLVNIDVRLRSFPNATERVQGTYAAAPNTEKIDLRATGRQVAFRFYGSSSPAFMRLGSIALDVMRSGATR